MLKQRKQISNPLSGRSTRKGPSGSDRNDPSRIPVLVIVLVCFLTFLAYDTLTSPAEDEDTAVDHAGSHWVNEDHEEVSVKQAAAKNSIRGSAAGLKEEEASDTTIAAGADAVIDINVANDADSDEKVAEEDAADTKATEKVAEKIANIAEEEAGDDKKAEVVAETSDADDDYFVLKTEHGNIQINFLPEYAPESVQYVREVVQSGCDDCRLYRAEKPGILQGDIKSAIEFPEEGKMGRFKVEQRSKKGNCPPEYEGVQQNCPSHDPQCGCHGPVMKKGMVGWAGGRGGGPDFFINTCE